MCHYQYNRNCRSYNRYSYRKIEDTDFTPVAKCTAITKKTIPVTINVTTNDIDVDGTIDVGQ
jgi:hypothetical protein